MDQRIIPLILCGGAGTRLWPASTASRPKQMLSLIGELTMFQATAKRIGGRDLFGPPMVIANVTQEQALREQLGAVGIDDARFVLEPVGRNTAAALALAAINAGRDDLLLALPSDHVIDDLPAFLDAVGIAAPLAREGWLMTFGIKPSHPETGYGYIRCGAALPGGAHVGERFVEKPDRATAEGYLADGRHLWNGGIFLFRAGDMSDALARHAPDILEAVGVAMAAGETGADRVVPDADAFARVRSQSIDHAVMESAERVGVVPVDMAWSDVGSWDALYDLSPKDAAGNGVKGSVATIDAGNNLLRADGPMIVAIGVEDLIVVTTPDAVLVMPRGHSQRVKEIDEAVRASRAAP